MPEKQAQGGGLQGMLDQLALGLAVPQRDPKVLEQVQANIQQRLQMAQQSLLVSQQAEEASRRALELEETRATNDRRLERFKVQGRMREQELEGEQRLEQIKASGEEARRTQAPAKGVSFADINKMEGDVVDEFVQGLKLIQPLPDANDPSLPGQLQAAGIKVPDDATARGAVLGKFVQDAQLAQQTQVMQQLEATFANIQSPFQQQRLASLATWTLGRNVTPDDLTNILELMETHPETADLIIGKWVETGAMVAGFTTEEGYNFLMGWAAGDLGDDDLPTGFFQVKSKEEILGDLRAKGLAIARTGESVVGAAKAVGGAVKSAETGMGKRRFRRFVGEQKRHIEFLKTHGGTPNQIRKAEEELARIEAQRERIGFGEQ